MKRGGGAGGDGVGHVLVGLAGIDLEQAEPDGGNLDVRDHGGDPLPDADQPVYALNLFDVADADEYRAYARASAAEVQRHGGRVVAMGRFHERVVGEVEARQVMILVEWDSLSAFEGYRDDPDLVELHSHRENGAANYVWMLFDRLEDMRPVLGLAQP